MVVPLEILPRSGFPGWLSGPPNSLKFYSMSFTVTMWQSTDVVTAVKESRPLHSVFSLFWVCVALCGPGVY